MANKNRESLNVDPLDKETQAQPGKPDSMRGSTHQRYVGNLALYGNGDFARQGEDTTDPGVVGGGNIVGTTLEELSAEELEERGIRVNDAYRELYGVKAQRAPENK